MSKIDKLIEKICPNGVRFEELKEICMVSIGEFVHKNKQREDAKYPVFNGGISNTGFYDEYNNEGNKILISARGANAGFINKIESRYWAGNSCYSIDIKDKGSINWLYVYYYLKNNEKSLLGQQQTGSIPAISKKQIESFKIPVPPLEVQCKIVHILDDFTLLSAELSAELKARQKQYEYYASKLFTSFKAKDYPMGELAKFVYGYTDKAIDNGNTRFIRITDINEQGCLKKDDIKYINMNEEAQKSLLKKGDLVMARTGATFGKTLYFDDDVPSVYASFLIKIIPDNTKLLNKYYWHFTKTQLYWSQANKLVTNGGQPQFNTPALKKIRIPIPTIDEQHKVVDILDRLDKICNDISEGLPAEIEARQKQYEYYRDKLLTFKELKVNE